MSPSTKRGFLAGLAAGCVAVLVSYILRVLLGWVFLPELAAQTLITITPGSIESGFVISLRSLAKYSAFTGGVVINVLLYGVLGALLFRRKSVSERGEPVERFLNFTLIAYCVLLAIGIGLFFTVQVQGSPVSLPVLLVSLVPPQLAFGGLLLWFKGAPPLAPNDLSRAINPPKSKKKFDRRRRLFIRAGVATAVGAAILAYGITFLLKPQQATGTLPDTLASLESQAVTYNSNFYVVDVDVFPPSIDASSWNLTVTGLVNTPLKLSLSDLQQMSVVEQYNTLECISNTTGGNLISTAKWTGVHLADILNMAGVQTSAEYIIFTAADGYTVGIPLDRAMMDGTLLAYEMNGVPLPTAHGYPLRAIVPGLYGMMNAKWITNIQVVNSTYEGYWQVRGWEVDAMYNTGSWIVVPGNTEISNYFNLDGLGRVPLGIVPIAGIAFAGDRGISKVEVSADGGSTWITASLIDPLSNYTWVFWSASWNPPATGDYHLYVRATDGQGNLQTSEINGPFPNGATGYDIVDISVVEASASSS